MRRRDSGIRAGLCSCQYTLGQYNNDSAQCPQWSLGTTGMGITQRNASARPIVKNRISFMWMATTCERKSKKIKANDTRLTSPGIEGIRSSSATVGAAEEGADPKP